MTIKRIHSDFKYPADVITFLNMLIIIITIIMIIIIVIIHNDLFWYILSVYFPE